MESHAFSLIEQIVLAVAMVTAVTLFVVFLAQKLSLVAKGEPTNRFDRIGARLWRFIRDVVFQYRVIKGRPLPGIMHAFVFWGFFAFLLEKLYHFPHHFGFRFPAVIDSFYGNYLVKFLTVVSIVVLTAVVGLAFRRGVLRPKALLPSGAAWIVLSFIAIIMSTFLVYTYSANALAIKVTTWLNIATILTFLVYIPMSKHLHLLFCPFNEFLKNFEIAKIRKLDLENEEKEDYGINTLKNMSWKDLFDTFTCIQCGRCNDQCPAVATNKALAPREMILDLQHALMDKKLEEPIVGTAIKEEILWQCTTCAGCEHTCPVGIEHLPKMIGMRRFKAANSEFPKELQNTFTGLERNGNPWNYGSHLRDQTVTEIDAPLFEEGTEYLLWMGCFANYDAGYRNSIKSFIQILKKAGVSFGVLPGEVCCGDPARRLGNEFLFSAMIESNIEMFKELKVKKVITACPHCMQTLMRDYKDFGIDLEVTHHTAFISELISTKKIVPAKKDSATITYHDPCYLSRYNGIIAEPREALKAFGYNVAELPKHAEKSFCCGGGGGTIFLEEHGERINHKRSDEIIGAKQGECAVACPFCYTMIKDGVKDKGKDAEVKIRDLAEIIAERL
ncbi:MAG: 4Fe-4S dicluster domain-containing protein [Spirochaetes bacterium]|nr:4Fe-4S dicluster domain-containing protein [Spirochaetota bacterium]